jgi:transcriptional regulator of acetoin/glycerol metabolism
VEKYWEDRRLKTQPSFSATIADAALPVLSEKDRIMNVLGQCRHNKTLAAELLGIDRTTLYRKLKTHGIAAKKSDTIK